jgi:hypothetical protein
MRDQGRCEDFAFWGGGLICRLNCFNSPDFATPGGAIIVGAEQKKFENLNSLDRRK